MSEKLELVTSFATLRAGMIVVVKSCKWCGRDHRAMCIKREENCLCRWPDGSTVVGPTWLVAPRFCRDSDRLSMRTIADRRAYRVIDDIESTTETKQRKSVST